MSLFSFKKDDSSVSIVLDIGNSSVSGALVYFSGPSKNPKVLFATKRPITIMEKIHEDKLLVSMISFLKLVLEDIQKQGTKHFNFRKLKNKSVDDVICIYASPWFVGKTLTIERKEKEPVVVSHKYLRGILDSQEEKTRKILEEEDIFGSGVEIVEKRIIEARLNGYKTHQPEEKMAKKIETSVFLGFIPKNVKNLVEKSIHSSFPHAEISHHTFLLSSYTSIHDMYASESHYLIIDVTGEVTDIARVSDGLLRDNVSFPNGKNFLIREISEEFNVPIEVGHSFLMMYVEGKCSNEMAARIEEVIDRVGKEWVMYLKDAYDTITAKGSKTFSNYITIDSDILPIFKKYMDSSFPDMNNVFVDYKKLNEYLDIERGTLKEIFILLDTYYVQRLRSTHSL